MPIKIATNTAGAPITVGSDPVVIAITPDGETVYVLNAGSDTVTPIDTVTNIAGPSISAGDGAGAIAISPKAKRRMPAENNKGPVTRPAPEPTGQPGPPPDAPASPIPRTRT